MQRHILIYGFSMFSMFFGSGNLVFPLKIGAESGGFWLLGFFGLFLTGIILPFLGVFVIKLHNGSYDKFFSEAGTVARVILPLFTLSLLGSFGVVPRCITVAHGGIEYIFPKLSLVFFSFVFCVACFAICLKDKRMIEILGKWLTPLKLLCLVILIILGITYATPLKVQVLDPTKSFMNGFYQGYETMDLFAAFFFSSIIFIHLQGLIGKMSDQKTAIKIALKPSLICIVLLSCVYLGFVFLGAHYQSLTVGITPELILPTIATHLMGEKAALMIAVIVIMSCLSTAVALNNAYARYLCLLFKVSDNKFPFVLGGTTLVSFGISLLDFKGIAAFLAPVLEVSYPGLIALTVLSIFVKERKLLKQSVFYFMIALMIWLQYF